MKKYLVLFLFGVSVTILHSQTTNNIDDGFGNIKMDQTLKPIESLLTEVKMESLWKPAQVPEMITKVYIVNISKLKTNDFFGLTVSRIEVQFDEENIYQFILFMEAPSKSNYKTFFNKLVAAYGYPPSTGFDENMAECPGWFSNITLLTVSGETATITKNGKKYIYADFVQGYGG